MATSSYSAAERSASGSRVGARGVDVSGNEMTSGGVIFGVNLVVESFLAPVPDNLSIWLEGGMSEFMLDSNLG